MADGSLQALGQEVLEIYGNVCNRVLRMAEASLPESQFRAFRRLVLDEFGEQGAQKHMKQLFKLNDSRVGTWQGARQGMERAGASANACERGGDYA